MSAADLLVLCTDCRRDGNVHSHTSHEGAIR